MRLMLWGFVTPIWEDVAPEVTVSSGGITYLQDTLGQSGRVIPHDLLIRYRLYVAWTGGLVVEFRLLHTMIVGSISSGGGFGVHCWWDLIWSKQLFSATYIKCRCLPDVLFMVILRCICICKNIFFVFDPKREKINLSKWVGPLRDLYVF